MATLKDLRKRFNKINLDSILIESIHETKGYLTDNLRSQIERGLLGTGGNLPGYANEEYAKKKASMGSLAPFGITDLKYSGSFLSKLFIKVYPNNILIRSRDRKNSIILKKYGPEVFVLRQDTLSIYIRDVLLPLIRKKIKK
jgi:hypothetical protein